MMRFSSLLGSLARKVEGVLLPNATNTHMSQVERKICSKYTISACNKIEHGIVIAAVRESEVGGEPASIYFTMTHSHPIRGVAPV